MTKILSRKKISFSFMVALAMVLAAAVSALAFTAPKDGSLGYEAYTMIITNGIGGAFGYIGGALVVLTGIILGVGNKYMPAISCIVFGTLLAGTTTLLTALGCVF
jgi:hypothetical protein